MGNQWNSFPLQITYEVLGWIAFVSWSISFYPQVILNFRRKRDWKVFQIVDGCNVLWRRMAYDPWGAESCLFMYCGRGGSVGWFLGTWGWVGMTYNFILLSTAGVVGLNFDFVILNLTKHSSYLIYNATLYFSSAVQSQYRDKYGLNEMIPVAANDVAFSIHAVILTAFTLFQIFIYERGNQKFSNTAIALVSVAWLAAAVCVFIALPSHSWLWLISVFNTIQVIMTVIKYIPQAVMNFYRKSTDGFSIGNILLDFLGGVTNYGQMAVQSIDQGSWVNFYGNIGKTLLSLVSIFFDLVFMLQHYVLYRGKKPSPLPSRLDEASIETLLNNTDHTSSNLV